MHICLPEDSKSSRKVSMSVVLKKSVCKCMCVRQPFSLLQIMVWVKYCLRSKPLRSNFIPRTLSDKNSNEKPIKPLATIKDIFGTPYAYFSSVIRVSGQYMFSDAYNSYARTSKM